MCPPLAAAPPARPLSAGMSDFGVAAEGAALRAGLRGSVGCVSRSGSSALASLCLVRVRVRVYR